MSADRPFSTVYAVIFDLDGVLTETIGLWAGLTLAGADVSCAPMTRGTIQPNCTHAEACRGRT